MSDASSSKNSNGQKIKAKTRTTNANDITYCTTQELKNTVEPSRTDCRYFKIEKKDEKDN